MPTFWLRNITGLQRIVTSTQSCASLLHNAEKETHGVSLYQDGRAMLYCVILFACMQQRVSLTALIIHTITLGIFNLQLGDNIDHTM